MGNLFNGNKTYLLLAAFAIFIGSEYMSSDMSFQELVQWVTGGGLVATLRSALKKVEPGRVEAVIGAVTGELIEATGLELNPADVERIAELVTEKLSQIIAEPSAVELGAAVRRAGLAGDSPPSA